MRSLAYVALAIILGLTLTGFASAGKFGSPPQTTPGQNLNKTTTMTTQSNLTDEEKQMLLYMLEEEKMARDVYKYFYDKYNATIFYNIMQSEEKHMEMVENLLDKYGINYTILGYGQFENPEIQSLYEKLIAEGSNNLSSAIQVGIMIEEKDIKDLSEYIKMTTKPDIINTFENLMQGSENHLQAFTSYEMGSAIMSGTQEVHGHGFRGVMAEVMKTFRFGFTNMKQFMEKIQTLRPV